MQKVIKGNLINYQVFGKSNTKTIVVLHGWGRTLDEWINFANTMSSEYKVVLIDLPAFGSSPPFPKNADLDDYIQVLGVFLNGVDVKKCTLIGHSFGGKLGIVLASKYKYIEKLILVAPSGVEHRYSITNIKYIFFKLLKPLQFLFPKKIRDNIIQKISSEDYNDLPDTMQQTFKNVSFQDVSSYARKIKIPTLIVWGENDPVLPLKISKILKRMMVNSRIRVVWGAKHDPHLEKPSTFDQIIAEFL
jgi:pimeloyl-ACP methyl ester carboxylesterase